jgi:putative peptide zinc metalloprotease protein
MFVIILYVGGKFFTIGIALAIWATITQLIIPMGKNMAFLFKSPRLQRNRKRSVGIAALIATVVIGLLFVLPAPLWTRAEGVTWPSEKSQVRAEADGFIVKLMVLDRSRVKQDQPIIETRDPFSQARVKRLEAQKKQLEIQLMAARTVDRVQTAIIREELNAAIEDLSRAHERSQALIIRSPRDGIFIVPREQDQEDRFVKKGQVVAFVTNPDDHTTVRAAVSQDDIGLVREYVRKVDVRSVGWKSQSYPAEVAREIHGGTHKLPTAALGSMGGGPFATDPGDRDGRTTLDRVFEIEISLPQEGHTEYLGTRMYVRFDHGYEPLGLQAWRALRQLFLRRFGV